MVDREEWGEEKKEANARWGCVGTGLTEDDASLHAERIKLWDNFNHAWLALGQKQLDLMQTETQTSQTQRPLATDKVEKLGDEIVRLCDGLERHGLVDYQYGVWEDQIIASKHLTPRADAHVFCVYNCGFQCLTDAVQSLRSVSI